MKRFLMIAVLILSSPIAMAAEVQTIEEVNQSNKARIKLEQIIHCLNIEDKIGLTFATDSVFGNGRIDKE